MIEVASGWQLEVERGPDCLIVRFVAPEPDALEGPPLADTIWSLMQQHLSTRVVLEMHELSHLNSYLMGQLLLLNKRVQAAGGMLRLCGLSPTAKEALVTTRLDDRFAQYPNRDTALGLRPMQPR